MSIFKFVPFMSSSKYINQCPVMKHRYFIEENCNLVYHLQRKKLLYLKIKHITWAKMTRPYRKYGVISIDYSGNLINSAE